MNASSVAAIIFCVFATYSASFSYALEIPSHEVVNEQAVRRSQLDAYLRQELALKDGIDQAFRGKAVFQWLREGGAREDDGAGWQLATGKARSYRHFHDPLQPWDRAGLSYSPPFLPQFLKFESSVRWAQRTDQNAQIQLGDFSWVDARRYYLTALTDPDPSAREQGFANTFRALGQVMHLSTDASVPEHVRNDPHPLAYVQDKVGQVGNYEYWVLAQHRQSGTESRFIQEYLSTPITLDADLLKIPLPDGEAVARVPIARLFDSDRYSGTNPDVTAESKIGIAEITNANFLSQDTGPRQYPHPAFSTMERYTGVYSKLGQKRSYYRKKGAGTPGGVGLAVDPVLAECVLDEAAGFEAPCNDDDVWRATARHMLPRAVGYSAGLLDYFFRGKLEVRREPHPETKAPSLRIINRSGEALGAKGVFTLYQDDSQGIRGPVPGASLTLEAEVAKDNDAAPLYLPLPADVQSGGLTLVYNGPLGLEQDAVIGKVLMQARLERIYLDGPTNEWMLQTASGQYLLPLRTVAGLTLRPGSVTWGPLDNQLVATTYSRPDPYEAVLFELARPVGSTDVPTTGEISPKGYPVAAVRLLQRIPIFDVLNAIDLGTTVDFTEHLEFTQYRLAFTVQTVCRVQDPPIWGYETYNCTSTFSDETLEPLRTLHDTVTARIPLALTPEHFGWGPAEYSWDLKRVWMDRTGHLVAGVVIQLAPLPGEVPYRGFPLLTPWRGTPVESGTYFYVQAKLEEPALSVLALVDLTAGRLLAKTGQDLIRVEKTQRALHPSPYYTGPCYLDVSGETLYIGGLRDGEREGPAFGAVNYKGPCASFSILDGRVVKTFAAEAGTRLDALDGLWQPHLALLGLGEAEAQTLPPEPLFIDYGYEIGSSGNRVNLRLDRAVPAYLGPAIPSAYYNRLWWFGPAPGRLAFQADAVPWSARHSPLSGPKRVWVGTWDLESGMPMPAYDETGPSVPVAVSGSQQGVFMVNEAGRSWLWAPWAGPTLVFPDRNPAEAWDYVALDGGYLVNVRTGVVHQLTEGLPVAADVAPFVPGGTRSDSYHVMKQ